MTRFLILLLSCFFVQILCAQNEIISIEYQGLNRTKPSYLSHFLICKIGESADSTKLLEDLQQLKNISSISGGTVSTIQTDSGVHVLYTLEEAWTIFPIVNFGGVKGNVWFQLGFSDVNFLGQGMQLSADYRRFDGRNNFNLFYRVPYISGSRWGTSISLLRYASIEPLYFDELEVRYKYSNLSATATASYKISRGHIIEAGMSGFLEEYEIATDSLRGIGPGPDELTQPKLLWKTLHKYDRINYHYFHLSGFDINSNAQAVYNIDLDNWFFILLTDFRGFHLFGRNNKYWGNLAYRFRFGISSNEDSPFAPFVLDSQVNIRGSGNRIDRGTGVLVFNLEYRHTVFENKSFGAQLALFSDLGTWRSPGGDLSELTSTENFRHFMGAGVRLIYKKAYDAILRVDYGIDIYDTTQRGLVIGVGQYF